MPARFAVIGASGHFYYAIESMKSAGGAELCACAPGSEAEDMSSLVECDLFDSATVKQYSGYKLMLEEVRPDVTIVNPFYFLHSEIIVECLRRNVSVISEKPFALDWESLRAVKEALEGSSAKLSIILDFRYDPRFYTAMELVRSGAIGKPLAGFSQKSYKLGERPWFYNKRETFGGLIPWVGIHAVDWFCYVSGLRYCGVYASHANLNAPQYPGMEDSASCMFDIEGGGSAVMSFDYLRPGAAPTHADDRLRLCGSEGTLEIQAAFGLKLIDSSGERLIELQSPDLGQLADFIEHIKDPEHVPLLTASDGLYANGVCLAARDSADRHEYVRIKEREIVE